jgi:hypothetical protein
LVVGNQFERLAALGLFRPLRAVGNEGLAGFGFFQAGPDRDRHSFYMVILPAARYRPAKYEG